MQSVLNWIFSCFSKIRDEPLSFQTATGETFHSFDFTKDHATVSRNPSANEFRISDGKFVSGVDRKMFEGMDECEVFNTNELNKLAENNINHILESDEIVGPTSYIDLISVSQMVTSSAIRGRDNYKRPFFVLRGYIHFNNNTYPFMQTFFQRYSDNEHLWVGCGHSTYKHLMNTDGGIDEYQAWILSELVKHGHVNIKFPLEARIKKVMDEYSSYLPPNLEIPVSIRLGCPTKSEL